MPKRRIKDKRILVLNAGSATLKWALYGEADLVEEGRGTVERIGTMGSFTEWRLHGKLGVKRLVFKDHRQAIAFVIKMLAWHQLIKSVNIIGHRIVHGGDHFDKPTKLVSDNIKSLVSLKGLAPLHNPMELEVVKSVKRLLPKIAQWAVFDTAWFVGLPAESRIYALPQAVSKKYNLKKYGFHGLSHSYVTKEAARILGKDAKQVNLVTCHLGSGSSLAAVKAGKPIDTTMGFTPLEGLVMCTRAGDIDPGLLIYLLKQPGLNLKKLEQWLNHESGLKGIAGSSDMREVMTRAGYEVLGFRSKKVFSTTERQGAKLALRIYLHRLQKYIGAYAAILGRVDAIVFTGGIGERNEVIRNLTMQGLPSLKSVPVLTIPTNEELAIARQIVDHD